MLKTPAELQEAGIKQISVLSQSHIVALLRLRWRHDLRGVVLDFLRQDRNIQFVGAVDTSNSMFVYGKDLRRLFLAELAAIQNPMTIVEYSYNVTVHNRVDPKTVRLADNMGGSNNGLLEALMFGNQLNVLIMFTDQTGYDRALALPIDQPTIWVVVQPGGLDIKIHQNTPTDFR